MQAFTFPIYTLNKKTKSVFPRVHYELLVFPNIYNIASIIMLGRRLLMGGSPLKVFDNLIWNFLDSWLDSKIPDFILEIPVHQIRKAYVT